MPTACQCSDKGCPHANMFAGYVGCSSKNASITLYRVDMNDRDGTLFCAICAADAMESGLFTDEVEAPPTVDDRLATLRQYIASNGIAQSPEGRRVFPDMTVEENLLMGTIPIGDKYAKEDMQRMFELFPRLEERRTQRAMTMSGGEQQMLAIARALMSRPKLLLLDEPSLGLAPIVVKQIFATLRELASTGMTIFLVEQNANHALKLSDRAYVMVNGEIRLSGTGKELLVNDEVRNAYLGGH